ncbi:MAG: hypothetical protein RLY84_784 [Actinomycetota bacterium]|jgi:hypothetical protein
MTEQNPKDLEKFWRRIGLIFFAAAVILVAGPQLIDLFIPSFR